MLTSLTLQNFRSFGAKQTIHLQPITVLVGPNNSGKSNLMSVGGFVQNAVRFGITPALQAAGDWSANLFHRPAGADATLLVEWEAGAFHYRATLASPQTQVDERLTHERRGELWKEGANNTLLFSEGGGVMNTWEPFSSLRYVAKSPRFTDWYDGYGPIVDSRLIKLALTALRNDAPVVEKPSLESDGSGLAALLGLWKGSDPSRSQQLDAFLATCLPEIKHVLVVPSHQPGMQRLVIEEKNGQRFDVASLSDGLLHFIALAMHVIDSRPGSLIFIEEPEQSIHPRRLSDIVELLRRSVHGYHCQFVVATHSPILLNQFREEPEAIMLFRRGEHGTEVTPLVNVPKLVEALQDRGAEPGEMLANGFFNDPF